LSEPVIQWFPGHMAKTLRHLEERLEVVDVVLEVVDARLPTISANPQLSRIAARRPYVTVATRADLADPAATKLWCTTGGHPHLAIEAKRSSDLKRVLHALESQLGRKRTGRMLVVGIPNSGKSTVINGLVGRMVARAENRAGVTRQLQWYRISPRLEVVDSPGVFMPKVEDLQAQWMLAVSGALPRERYDVQIAIHRFQQFCAHNAGRAGMPRKTPPTLAEFAENRGFKRRGNVLDLENASLAYLKALNEAGFGRFSFEAPGLETPPVLEPLPLDDRNLSHDDVTEQSDE
jgi:ribosome biogenesis GTPase A